MAISQWFKILCAHIVATAISLIILCYLFEDTVLYCYSYVAYFILYAVIAYNTFDLTKSWFLDERIVPSNKAVFITGCDSGFGNQLAKRLDLMGFQVFAGSFLPEGEGAQALKQTCSDRLHVVGLDVRSDKNVEDALKFVKENLGSNKLWAVVNNAGVNKGFLFEFTTMEDFKETMEVNTFGTVRVTKAFLPLLKKSKGRVVNVTSLAARCPTFDLTAYSVSKVASLTFTQCLSQEMSLWGVRAISIEPEFFQTPITSKENFSRAWNETINKLPEDIIADYGEDFIENVKNYTGSNSSILSIGQDSYLVIEDMVAAITQKCPSLVYRPRHNIATRCLIWLLEHLPFEWRSKLLWSIKYYFGFPIPKALKSKSS